ncbi:1,2-phenylacetyl-CoA epoxidase subunit PaaD [Catelliglobosispora koreensis]|uniref:1,2-phenylacetyl-CoA epoxidase subunit PaaD n=1 Tax=Catelliglobosispora koreensis TaxID=129052 RepID=UPI00037134E5|nr:1,2-phenylacetyl-CoA epoxidase subunit PaaD [Catelliglobosispora koreensis]
MSVAYEVVAAVKDPELPVITIADLGVLRSVSEKDGHVRVVITPTYSGCPAMDAIRFDIETALTRNGFGSVEVVTSLSPAWSTDMITSAGRAALAKSGIAPPVAGSPACPHCASSKVLQISRYASTACQSLWKCHSCAEPFNAVKTL